LRTICECQVLMRSRAELPPKAVAPTGIKGSGPGSQVAGTEGGPGVAGTEGDADVAGSELANTEGASRVAGTERGGGVAGAQGGSGSTATAVLSAARAALADATAVFSGATGTGDSSAAIPQGGQAVVPGGGQAVVPEGGQAGLQAEGGMGGGGGRNIGGEGQGGAAGNLAPNAPLAGIAPLAGDGAPPVPAKLKRQAKMPSATLSVPELRSSLEVRVGTGPSSLRPASPYTGQLCNTPKGMLWARSVVVLPNLGNALAPAARFLIASMIPLGVLILTLLASTRGRGLE